MSIHTVGKGATGFSDVESITVGRLSYGLTISMDGDGVSDISAGAGEGVGGIVNEAGLTSGSIARLGASGVEALWGWRLMSTISWLTR